MHKEIERKFLTTSREWEKESEAASFRQGYLPTGDDYVTRVRIEGDEAYLTIKTKTTKLSRLEYQYPIPMADARSLLDELCRPLIVEKTRHKVMFKGLLWEIDVFEGENKGLILAEVELESEDQKIDLPPWIGEEVSYDPRYYNVNLAKNPYRYWKENIV